MRIDFVRRKARGGKGLLPPNNTQWEFEHHGLDVREALGLPLDAALPDIGSVFQRLLPSIEIYPHGAIPMAAVFANHFRFDGRSSWSGLALEIEDGTTWVIYNDAHPTTRTRATLMEELFHIYLQHPHSTVRLLADREGPSRTYNPAIEKEAYCSAAACLIPYAALKRMVVAGWNQRAIAAHFQVSPKLTAFRLKVTKLYRPRNPPGRPA